MIIFIVNDLVTLWLLPEISAVIAVNSPKLSDYQLPVSNLKVQTLLHPLDQNYPIG